MLQPNGILSKLARGVRSFFRSTDPMRTGSPHPPRLGVEELEPRNAPSTVIQLPAEVNQYELTFDGGDAVIRFTDGTEFYRGSISSQPHMTIRGTPVAETIRIAFPADPSALNAVIVSMDGGGGADSVIVKCSSGADQVTLQPSGVGTVVGPGYNLSLVGFPTVWVTGNGGKDSVLIRDTTGDDVACLTGTYGWIRNTQSGIYHVASGFQTVTVQATAGGKDSVWLYDTAENNVSTISQASASLRTLSSGLAYMGMLGTRSEAEASAYMRNKATTLFLTAQGFTYVATVANAGGYDTVWVTGTAGADTLYVSPSSGYLKTWGRIDKQFVGFENVNVQGNGGTDTATLLDSRDADVYQGSGTKGRLASLTARYEVNIGGFSKVYLAGTSGGLNVITLTAPSYAITAPGFAASQNYFFNAPLARPMALYWLKQIALQIDPKLATTTNAVSLAIMLRNDVHNWIRKGANSASWGGLDAYTRAIEATLTQREPLLCGGLQMLYTDLLEAFGLQGRYVALWAADNYNNHASVEVLLMVSGWPWTRPTMWPIWTPAVSGSVTPTSRRGSPTPSAATGWCRVRSCSLRTTPFPCGSSATASCIRPR
jgi:hypothetical protein